MSDMPKIELDLERAVPPPAAKSAPMAPPPLAPSLARPYAPPQAPLAYGVEPSYLLAGLRLAGLIILLNVGLSVWLLGQGQTSGFMVGSLVVDAIIAPMLLLGKESVRKWAFVRSILGFFVGSMLAYALAASTPYAWGAVALNAGYCGGLILLLMGEEVGLARLVSGSALSGLAILAIIGAIAFAQSMLNREPTTQTALNGRVSLLAFNVFKPHPHELPPNAAAKFDEFSIEQALSPAGTETVWIYRPKAGVTMDPDKALRAAFRGFQSGLGDAPSEVSPQAETHGNLDGEGLSGTVTVKGRPLRARMFITEQGGADWMFLVLLPSWRDPATANRILDSIQINS